MVRRERKTAGYRHHRLSSGSTGTPKGVMLSYNVSRMWSPVQQVFIPQGRLHDGRAAVVSLVWVTGTVWLPLIVGWRVVYHPNPLDAKTIGEMVHKYKATILISTPTFYASYSDAARQRSSRRYALPSPGRRSSPSARSQAFKEKYRINLLGYGCTEMAPAISINAPDVEHGRISRSGSNQEPRDISSRMSWSKLWTRDGSTAAVQRSCWSKGQTR
jgi:acyl-[acyl-carrier-protein]-phospholipid O-acyltransferase/long-chain-fatty-acid--[acyl-carrier-protein] ligase